MDRSAMGEIKQAGGIAKGVYGSADRGYTFI